MIDSIEKQGGETLINSKNIKKKNRRAACQIEKEFKVNLKKQSKKYVKILVSL